PNLDAMTSLRFMDRRGEQLIGQLRYLTYNSTGELNIEYLSKDESVSRGLPPDEEDSIDEERGLFNFTNSTTVGGWRSDTLINLVSDKEYFEDFGDSLFATSRNFLRNTLSVSRATRFYNFRTIVQGHQIVDSQISDSSRPFDQVPEITFNYNNPFGLGGLNYSVEAELTNFQRDGRPSGFRSYVKPRLSWPVNKPGYFFTPSFALTNASYDYRDPALNDAVVKISRTVPIASLDSGLFFDREFAGGRLLQTLEPRFYYLYVPFRDQDDINVFDTREAQFNFVSLFRDNRFAGPDRQGDANQLSIGVSSRIISAESGRTLVSGGIGQTLFFEDREVTLTSKDTIDARSLTRKSSNLLGELSLSPARWWSARATAEWDPEINNLDRIGVQWQFEPAESTVVNVAYRFRDGEGSSAFKQTDLSFAVPINPRWRVVGRWNFSLLEHRSLETFLGFEYESCCWAFRIIKRRFITNSVGDFDSALFFQLELKGMTSVGKRVDEFLQQDIQGFE
ncbi:MAG: LPS assembly protein LptD, partial [Gammaproteobacteria bacterium]|nr:LPS assembly protein LptD [Gammaproteobacteria bacterium]